jgi:predicted nucleic acid-binding protein
MPRFVIADASVLIILDKIDQLNLLRQVYKEIFTTPEISKEFGKSLPKWINVESPSDIKK